MIFSYYFSFIPRPADLMRRAAANLLHRVVADGIGQPAALPAAFAPYYRDAAVVLRHLAYSSPP